MYRFDKTIDITPFYQQSPIPDPDVAPPSS